MKLLDVTSAQPAFAVHEGKESLKNLGVVLDYPRNQLRISIRGIMRNVRRINTPLDQSLRNPAIQRIDSLDDARFDSPLSRKFSVEVLDALVVPNAFLFSGPNFTE